MVQGLSIILLAFVLTGCASITSDAWVKPILISKDDILTKGTAAQILIHNESQDKNK